MDLEKELLKEHSKKMAVKVATWASQNEANFKQFLDVFLNGEYRVNQRAAWSLSLIADRRIDLVLPHLGILVENLKQDGLHNAIKRNTVRFLQDIDIPEEHMGTIADICFNYLADPKESVATKAFSMTVLLNITKKYPEFKNELKLLIEEQLPHGSTGFKNRGNKVLLALEKID